MIIVQKASFFSCQPTAKRQRFWNIFKVIHSTTNIHTHTNYVIKTSALDLSKYMKSTEKKQYGEERPFPYKHKRGSKDALLRTNCTKKSVLFLKMQMQLMQLNHCDGQQSLWSRSVLEESNIRNYIVALNSLCVLSYLCSSLS